MKFLLPALVLATSIIGSIANINITSDSWYDELVKSSLNPPGFVFGIVWPILYILMAIVSFQASEKIWKLFIFQLILNAAWSWIFFYFQAPLIALLDITFLIVINLKIMGQLRSFSTMLFLLYLPYLLWLFFAAFLNISIIYLN
ncbi:tryptophan-rich sensory protein [Gammaproteobacteria bacterium]|jgi:benzodiazapine receptor|nr:tryptophan-rich sensory protein [Gammaproteobacteria bacterium]MDA9935660.1 tryptophan-rich sensory protein [Gammaproteobacteria bacterium]MDA9965226.1 tryptophan-rich sensory protein [Gammaproteobacteria bacterium]MDC0332360.1 tryptophan-rich sensory protein [Gammaproteobacteria bacterium]MDC0512985.1 tryptophan-rich sensory protein [Gammaproteobacteria bacterium]